MVTKKKAANEGAEWVGGVALMPMSVGGEGEPYQPEILVWINPEGLVLGMVLGKPGEVISGAAKHLRDTMKKPMVGKPTVPARVRVASKELASALAAAGEEFEIVCAPTPELGEVFEAMFEHLGGRDAKPGSYLNQEVEADAVASFFRAAAALFRFKPWSMIPNDQSVLAVSIPKLGVRDALISVIGQEGETFGIIVFSSAADLEAFLEAAAAAQRGEHMPMPPHFALTFDRVEEVDPALQKEIAEHKWEVAGDDAYPWLLAVDEGMAVRDPTAKELSVVEAIALAMPQVLGEAGMPAKLESAWSGGEAVLRTLVVAAHVGPVEVSIGTSYPVDEAPGAPKNPSASKGRKRH